MIGRVFMRNKQQKSLAFIYDIALLEYFRK